MSIPIDEILATLRNHKIEGDNLTAIAKDLIAVERELKEEKANEKEPRAKTKLVVLIRGDASLKRAVEGGAYVVSVKQDDNTATLLERIKLTVKDSNEKIKRGRASRVIRTFARAMEWLKPKALKLHGIQGIKNKTPVEVVVVESPDI